MNGSSALPARAHRARRLSGLLAAVVAALLVLQVEAAAPAAAAEPLPTTYQGPSFPDGGPSPTQDKPQSKLWYADGSWWAVMLTGAGVTIHRLQADHTWVDTGVLVDDRLASTADVLWEGGKLYVSSRTSNGTIRASRFGYDATGDTYTREVYEEVAGGGTESTTIARDSLGRLWVTYTQGQRVYVAHTTTDDQTWTDPFLVPVPDHTIGGDDIAAIIAFGGRIGVMWSDQGNDVIRFAIHQDSAPDDVWTVENALAGTNLADDHINLKSLLEDDQGRIYAAVKTSRGDSGEPGSDPSIVVLQRTSSGVWTYATAATVSDRLTRPQIVLDRTNRQLYVLMSTESGGTVYFKRAPLGALSFPAGRGTPFVKWSGASINNATTTKQAVDATTGLVVLASDEDANIYYHGELSLAPGNGDVTAPTVPEAVTATATSGTSASVSWAPSTDDVGVTDYRVFRDGIQVGSSTGTSFSDGGLSAGTTYSYMVAAADAAGNVSAQSAPATVTPEELSAGTVTFVGAASVAGSGSSSTVPGPAGAGPGDLLVAAVSARGAPDITPPPGWTLVRADSNGFTMRQHVFVAPATADNTTTWSITSAKDHVVQVLAYRGVDLADPVVAASGATGSSATVAHPSAAAVDGAQVVTVAGIGRQTALTSASPLIERSEIINSAAQYKISANAADTTARGTGAGPYTTDASGSAGNIGQTLVLRPGSGGGGTDTTPPSMPTGVSATATSPTTVDLTWQASTDDTGVTEYRVYRDGTQVGTATTPAFSDTGLAATTTYRYTVTAVDAAGNVSDASPAAEARTPAESSDTTPPSAPTGVSATATSPTTVDLTWQASTDDVGVTEYRVLRDGTQVGTTTTPAFSDTGLVATTTYLYTVTAVDAAGNVSAASEPASAATPDDPGSGGGGGTATFVAAATGTSDTTSTAVPGPAGVQAGDVLIAAVSHRGTGVITPGPGWTRVRDDANGTTMRTAVYVKVATGSDESSTWTLSRTQTTVVQVLAYRGVDTADPVVGSAGTTTSGTTLTSPAVTSAAGGPVVAIAGLARPAALEPAAPLTERSELTNSTATYKLTAGAADTPAVGSSAGPFSTTASSGTSGVAQIVALRPGSGSAPPPDPTDPTDPTDPDTTPPSVPTGVTAAPTSPTTVDLAWEPATDDVGVTGYRVFRDGTEVGTATGTTWTDTGLTAETAYAYTVAAADAAGNLSGQSSPPVTATTPAADGGADTTPPSVPTGVTAAPTSPTTVDLAWEPATDDVGVTGYRVFRDGTEVGTATGTTWTDTGLTAETAYAYTVAAADAAGNLSGQSSPPVTATTPAATPPPATGAAAFVSAATGSGTTAGVAVPSPAGVQAGDVLVAAVSFRGNAVVTPGPGWTLVRDDANGFLVRQLVFVKVAAGADEPSTWTLSREQTTAVQVLAYRGVDTTAPVVAAGGQATSSETLTGPVVESAPGGPVITVVGLARVAALEPEAPLTERAEVPNPSGARYALTAGAADTGATGTSAGPFSITASGSAGGVAQTIALRPAA